MDHEVVRMPYKICNWLLNSSRGHTSLHQGKHIKLIMKFEILKRHILRPTLFIDMVQHVSQWERQKRCFVEKKQGPMAKKIMLLWFLMFFYWGENMKANSTRKKWSNIIFTLKTTLLGHIFKINQHIHFLVHGHSSWSTFGLHLVRNPNTLKGIIP